jgi:hypothetical protein
MNRAQRAIGRTATARSIVAALGLLVAGAALGYTIRAHADGIPDANPLYYAGTLTEGGQLVTGQRALTVNLWPDAMAPGTPLCQTVVSNADVTAGHFRIPLVSTCKASINQNKNAWVELIDGATSLSRTKIGAIPYAIEADHAVSATTAAHAATADTATTATNALTTVAGSEIVASDPFGQACITNLGALDCGVAASRKCASLNYKSGWFVGEWGSSHDASTRTSLASNRSVMNRGAMFTAQRFLVTNLVTCACGLP